MDEESVFDFETEIMDQYAVLSDEQSLDFDDYSVGLDAESYDP